MQSGEFSSIPTRTTSSWNYFENIKSTKDDFLWGRWLGMEKTQFMGKKSLQSHKYYKSIRVEMLMSNLLLGRCSYWEKTLQKKLVKKTRRLSAKTAAKLCVCVCVCLWGKSIAAENSVTACQTKSTDTSKCKAFTIRERLYTKVIESSINFRSLRSFTTHISSRIHRTGDKSFETVAGWIISLRFSSFFHRIAVPVLAFTRIPFGRWFHWRSLLMRASFSIFWFGWLCGFFVGAVCLLLGRTILPSVFFRLILCPNLFCPCSFKFDKNL